MDNKTKVKIKREYFDSFDDATLAWTCIEPTIQKIQGRNLSVKSHTYLELSPGQKSLLIYWILIGHSRHGVICFFKELDYLFNNTDMWIEFNDKLKCFKDDNLLLFIKEMESLFNKLSKTNNIDLDLQLSINEIDRKYNAIMPNSFGKVGKYIRDNLNEFVYLED